MTDYIAKSWLRRLQTVSLAADRQWPWLLAFFFTVLLAGTLVLDSRRPFWNDELFTYYISRQPSLGGVWSALATGAEQLPIFFFIIIRSFTSHSNAGPLSFRIPETFGFLVMSLSAFFFVRKRTPAAYGLIAFLLPAVTDAYAFAYEARPYGLVMGFAGLAVLSWQHAVGQNKRLPTLVALTIFLACATNCHYYAILLLFPFCLAEFVRFVNTRKLDVPMYLALLLSLVPLVLALPLIRAASRFSGHFWAKPGWTSIISFYETLFMPAGLTLLLMVLVGGLFVARRPTAAQPERQNCRLIAHEIALAVGFTLLPVVAVVLAKLVTGAFTPRYAIYSVLGISILIAWSLSRIGRNQSSLALVLSFLTLGCWAVLVVRQYSRVVSSAQEQIATFEFLRSQEGTLPIVIVSPHEFFVQAYHADRSSKGKFHYLADVPLALHYSDTDTVERGLVALKDYAPLHVEDYNSFVRNHPRFLLYGQPGAFGWTMQELVRVGKSLSVVARNGDNLLYIVSSEARIQR